MCLILTAFAAVISTIVWYFKASDKSLKVSTLALMYWGASLMWCVDGIFAVREGEFFFDLSLDDAFLGMVVILAGLIVWLVMVLFKDPKGVIKKSLSTK